jgi:hypothetical protein
VSLTLAIILAVAVIGQLCLPLIGAYNYSRMKARAMRRARLLEAAADQQATTAAKLDGTIHSPTLEPKDD